MMIKSRSIELTPNWNSSVASATDHAEYSGGHMTLTSYRMLPYGPWQRRRTDKAPGMMSGVTESKVIVVTVAGGMDSLPQVAGLHS